jgi:O-antigen/teichoic acid export membrane protein
MIHALIIVDVLAGTGAMALTWLMAPVLARLSGDGPGIVSLLRGYAIALPWLVLANGTCLGVLRVADRFRLLTTKSVILSLSRLLLVLAALGSGAGAVVLAYVAAEVLDAAATLIIVHRVLRAYGLSLVPHAWSRMIAALREARLLLGQMWVSGTIKGLITRLDIPLLARLSSPAAVASYRVALDLAGVLAKLGNPVQQAILPEMVALQARADRAGQRRLAAQSTLALAVPIIPALLAIMVGSSALLGRLVGPSFQAAGPVLALVALGIGVNTLLIWSRPLLVARSRVGTGNLIAAAGGLIQLGVIAAFAGSAGALAAGVGNAGMLVFVSVAGAAVGLR